MEAKNKHLEMIQGVVSRMGQTSFLLKGWSVLLVSGLFALASKEANIYFIYTAYFPVLAFWGLDAYYLRQERLFRKLYDRVRLMEDSAVDFSMDTSLVSGEVDCWFCVAFSKTLFAFHGAVFCTILVIMIIILRAVT
jgi:hypothetical protein